MKAIIVIIVLCTSLSTYAQDKTYTGMYMGFSLTPSIIDKESSHLRLTFQERLSIVNVDVSYVTNFKEDFVQLRMGFGYISPKLSAYVYLPYMNYRIGVGYNTPFCVEVMWKDKISFNFDIYENQIIPSFRVRTQIFDVSGYYYEKKN